MHASHPQQCVRVARRRLSTAIALAALALPVGVAQGQSSGASGVQAGAAPAAAQDPRFAYGMIGGAGDLPGSASMQALSVLLQYRVLPSLAVTVNPSVVRATVQPIGSARLTSTGLTDLPVGVTFSQHLARVPFAPEVAAGTELSLPVGDTARGLGSGQTGVAGELGVGVSPTDALSLDLDAWHPFAGAGVNSLMDASRATSLSVEAAYQWTERVAASLGYVSDVGRADSGSVLPQSVVAGMVFRVASPLALTVDGASGLTRGAPRWLLSIGLGTAFTEVTPIGPNSLVSRVRHAFGRSVNRGHGQSKVGGTCRQHAC